MRNNSIYRVTCLHVHEKSNLFRYKICQNTSVIGEEDMFPLVPRLPDGQRCILPHVLKSVISIILRLQQQARCTLRKAQTFLEKSHVH